MNQSPNKSVETNRRPASQFNTGGQYESALFAPPSLSAAVAHLQCSATMRIAVLILAFVLSSGCQSAKYSVNVKNLTTAALTDVRIVFPDHTIEIEELITEPQFPAHFLSFPISGRSPRSGKIEFRTPDGMAHSIGFEVPKLQIRGADGAVCCFIKIHSTEKVSVEEWKHDHLFHEPPSSNQTR